MVYNQVRSHKPPQTVPEREPSSRLFFRQSIKGTTHYCTHTLTKRYIEPGTRTASPLFSLQKFNMADASLPPSLLHSTDRRDGPAREDVLMSVCVGEGLWEGDDGGTKTNTHRYKGLVCTSVTHTHTYLWVHTRIWIPSAVMHVHTLADTVISAAYHVKLIHNV